MSGRDLKRRVIGTAGVEQHFEHLADLTAIEPDSLRDKVHNALSVLPPEDRDLMRDRLLAVLRKVGVHIGSCLLILGIPARTTDDLTPLEISKLVRYVRINQSEAFKAVAGTVGELFAASRRSQEGVKKVA
jgi:hypothetical protein